MQTRKYPGVQATVPQLVNELREFFDNADFKEVQVRHELESTIVEAKKIGKARELSGLAYSLTIKITPAPFGTNVAIGRQRWGDKAVAGAVWGLLTSGLGTVPAAMGAYNQYRLTENAWDVVERHMALASGGDVFEQQPSHCQGCGAETPVASRFCANCGSKVDPHAQ